MTDKDAAADSCPIIDEFVGQGTPVARESRQAEQTAAIGCTILTEFTGQGQRAKGSLAPPEPAESRRSASQGCEAITTFSDEGFVPVAASTKAEKNGGVSKELAQAKRES
jgi:hypothetical protein